MVAVAAAAAGTGPLLGKLILGPFELFPDGDAAALGLVQHLSGILGKAGGHGVGLSRLEEKQIVFQPGFIKGVVHIPLPGHAVKELCISGQLDAVGGNPVAHELFHCLPAMGRLPLPVLFGDLAPDGRQHKSEAPGRQSACFERNRDGAAGDFFIDDLCHLPP